MKFSKMLVLALVITVCIALAMPSMAAGPKYNWKLASVLNESHPVNAALAYFCTRVGELTKGQVKVTLFPGGQLGQETDYIQGCSVGSIEITKVSASPLSQYSEKLNAVGLPFIWNSADHQHKVLDGKVGKTLMASLEPKGFKGLAFMDAGFRNFSLRDKAVKTPTDLKGLKIRVQQSKLMLDTVAAFGATAVPMGMSDVYTALQTKVIDGWENNEPSVLQANMQEVCKYYSYTRHTSVPDMLIMSKKVYDSVPANIQKAIMQAAYEATLKERKIWADMMGKTITELKAKGMLFNEVNNIKDFQKVVAPVVKQYEAQIGPDLIKQIRNTK